MSQKVLIAFHGRLPDPRAAALFAVIEAKSLTQHAQVTLVVPKRDTTDSAQARELYQIPAAIEIVVLPTIDVQRFPVLRRFAFHVSLISFSVCMRKYLQHNRDSGWIVTTDHLVALAGKSAGAKVLLEIHDFPSTRNPIWRKALQSADRILSTNSWKRNELIKRFAIPEERIFVERNGVDLSLYEKAANRDESRRRLGITEGQIAVYTGHLYAWKGVDTFIESLRLIPEVTGYVVGGSGSDVSIYKGRYKDVPNIRFVGYRPHEEIPVWQSAADILVLPNTNKEEIASHYTSPMKLFEYMASGRPIVASRVPSISEVLTEDMAYLVEPDKLVAFEEGIRSILNFPAEATKRSSRARSEVTQYSWESRAKRLAEIVFI